MARVLLVDDEPDIRHVLASALLDEHHEVRTASNGADALIIARDWLPDVIVLDLMLPAMNGWQFAERYHEEPGPHAPIIAVTAAGPGAIRAAQDLETISAVLPKPVRLDELGHLVTAYGQATPR